MRQLKPFNPSEDFVESISEQVDKMRARLTPDEDFVGEYLNGTETITITHIGTGGRETVRLIGFDVNQRPCYIFAHVASVKILFRISKITAEHPKPKYGFTVDSAKQ